MNFFKQKPSVSGVIVLAFFISACGSGIENNSQTSPTLGAAVGSEIQVEFANGNAPLIGSEARLIDVLPSLVDTGNSNEQIGPAELVPETIGETSESTDENTSSEGGDVLIDSASLSCDFSVSAETIQAHWVESDTGQTVPPYKVTLDEPLTGAKRTRVSSNAVFGLSNGRAVHRYSKRQAWNADQTLMDIGERTVSTESLDVVNGIIPITNERNWSNTDPEVMHGIRFNPEPNELAAANMITGVVTTIKRFEEYTSCTLGDFEGNFTRDDSRVLLACTRKSNNQRTLISYDVKNDSILGSLDADPDYNWGGYSQSGQYILVENHSWPDSNPEMIRYKPDFSEPLVFGSPAHGDFGFDSNGDDIYAMIRWDVIDYIRLRDGHRVSLSISDNSNPIGHGHISCRNTQRPGWCYFSSYQNLVGAVEMKEGATEVQLWGFHRSDSTAYLEQPKATASRLGDKVMYISQWYSRGEINSYTLGCS